MVSKQEAEKKVEEKIASYPLPDGDRYILLKENTITKDWGWVYFYTSEKWEQTGDLQYAVAGNAPFIVEKATGNVIVTGTAEPVENYINRYEATGNPHA